MNKLLCIADFETAAKEKLPHMAWEFLSSGAGDEITLRQNREVFDQIKLLPKVLVDVSQIDTTIKLFNKTLEHPILVAPAAYNKFFHSEGEIGTAMGAIQSNAAYIMSTMANTTIEEIAEARNHRKNMLNKPIPPLWYQLYVTRNKDYTLKLIERAVKAGCEALVITVDTPILGNRLRETRAEFRLSEGLDRAMLRDLPEAMSVAGHQVGIQGIYNPLVNPAMTWEDIKWIISAVKVPVLLKGILNPDDAEKAVQIGAQGIIVSNHGARNLDTVPTTLEMLPKITERVNKKIPVLFDGGICRGTDILKALAFGASAVLIGRAYVWGLAVGGAAGVAQVVETLLKELKISMALTGRPTIDTIDSSVIINFSPRQIP